MRILRILALSAAIGVIGAGAAVAETGIGPVAPVDAPLGPSAKTATKKVVEKSVKKKYAKSKAAKKASSRTSKKKLAAQPKTAPPDPDNAPGNPGISTN